MSPDEGYNFSYEECSYLTVITPVTSVAICILPGIIIDKIGRRYSLFLLAVIQLSVCLLSAFSRHIYLFYFARFLTGVSDAATFAILPVYLGEMLTPKVRGTWGNTMSIMIYLGQFLINAIGGYLTVRTTSLIIMSIPLAFLFLFPFLPESPYYYVMKDEPEEAKRVLRKLRRIPNVDAELKDIEDAIRRQLSEPGSWRSLFQITSNRRAILAAVVMRTTQAATGYSAFSYYTKLIFQKTSGSFSATESSIILNAILPVTCILGAYLMDKLGRRFALMYSTTGMTLMCVGKSVYFYIERYHPEIDLSDVRFVPLVLFMIYDFIWCTGLGMVPNLMLGEIFSASVKGKGLCVANIATGLTLSASAKIFQTLEANFGLWSPFAFFAACSVVCLFFVYRVIPETRRKTLEEIQLSLKGYKGYK